MTPTFLDPVKVSELEPSEGDARSKAMLSPSAVPRSVSVELRSPEKVYKVEFQYSGDEPGGEEEVLDDRNDPIVTVRTSSLTNKILELSFSMPVVGIVGLSEVAERLLHRAPSISPMSKRLSYKMIAVLLVESVSKLVRAAGGAGLTRPSGP